MKKILFIGSLCVFAAIAAGIVIFAFKTYQPKAAISTLILDENVEALTGGDVPTITCGKSNTKGHCWKKGIDLKYCKEYSYYGCYATGVKTDYCTEPC